MPKIAASILDEFHTQVTYVLDGGALLHRVPWPKQTTYEELYMRYSIYVQQKYRQGTAIVFDGYEHQTTKSMTQRRRTAGKVDATVSFEYKMKVTMKKDVFLANPETNKKRFIAALRPVLEVNGYRTSQADR